MLAMTTLPELRAQLKSAFVGRDAEIDGILTAIIARTHVLLLGPPGTAKSLLTTTFCNALGGQYFELLLAKQSTPDELFGSIDVEALDKGQGVKRDTRGMMPEAHVAFLDEIFKANSAILNSLLTLLNERKFKNYGGATQQVPLQICVGASNEYPEDSSLEALYDRFQLRFWTEYVPTRSMAMRLLTCSDPADAVTAKLSLGDIATLQVLCKTVEVPANILEELLDIRESMAREHGIVVSDRRLRQSLRLIQARAMLNGRTKATSRDLMVLADSLWHRHDQRPAVLSTVMKIAAPDLQKAQALYDSAREAYDEVDWSSADSMQRALGIIRKCMFDIDTLVNLNTDDADIANQRDACTELSNDIGRRYRSMKRIA
jgi:MoxR-like ATPase